MPSKVKFFFDETRVNLKDRKRLKEFIEYIFEKEKTSLNLINYVFCTDIKLLEINQEYLKHNYLTDIITFDLAEKGSPVIAEVYISIDRVKENAGIQNVSFRKELYRVMSHGALHLCGYRDKSLSEKKKMRSKEDYYLKEILS